MLQDCGNRATESFPEGRGQGYPQSACGAARRTMMQCGSHRSIVRPAVAGGCPARNQPRGVWSDLSRGAVVFRVRWAAPGKVARPGRQRNRKRTSHDRRRVTSCPVSKPISGAPSCRPVRCRIRWNASFGCGSMRFSCRQPPATPAGTGPVFRFRGRSHWDAWHALSGVSREDAMAEYVFEVSRLKSRQLQGVTE